METPFHSGIIHAERDGFSVRYGTLKNESIDGGALLLGVFSIRNTVLSRRQKEPQISGEREIYLATSRVTEEDYFPAADASKILD